MNKLPSVIELAQITLIDRRALPRNPHARRGEAYDSNSDDAAERKQIPSSTRLISRAKLFIELDENTIAAQAFVFFAAGYETSSNTIAFCLHELALNQEIQERARRDIRDAIEARGGKLTYEAVQEMKYLDMVIAGTSL